MRSPLSKTSGEGGCGRGHDIGRAITTCALRSLGCQLIATGLGSAEVAGATAQLRGPRMSGSSWRLRAERPKLSTPPSSGWRGHREPFARHPKIINKVAIAGRQSSTASALTCSRVTASARSHVMRSFTCVVSVDLLLRFASAECEQYEKIGEREHKADVVVAESDCRAHDSGIEDARRCRGAMGTCA